jgi:hypothetical protein
MLVHLLTQEYQTQEYTLEAVAVDLIVDKLVLREMVELVVVEQEEEILVEQLPEHQILVVEVVEKEHIPHLVQEQMVVQE